MTTFAEELIEEFGEKVIALAQHLGLETDLDETEFQISENEEFEDEEEKQERLQELADERHDKIEEIKDELNSIVNEYDNTYSYGREEYIVATDEEADEIEDEYLDNYLEECIYPELPENLRFYFDDEAWKRDARMDGRGHCISTYDGCEYEEKVNGTWYYIYRTN